MAAGMRACALALALGLSLRPHVARAQQPQKPPAPSVLSDEGKELWNDIDDEADPFSDNACEMREKVLKDTVGKSGQEAQGVRIQLLMTLGVCEFKKGNYDKAKIRMASCISEINMPSMDALLKNPAYAHIGFFQQGAELMAKQEVTQAATQLRRCREVQTRNLKKILTNVHKQLKQQGNAPPLQALIDDIPGYGKTGNVLPSLMPAVPGLKTEMSFAGQVDKAVGDLDTRVTSADPAQKANRLRLASKNKEGALLYVQALPTDATSPGSRLLAATEIKDQVAKHFTKEAAKAEKGITLVKNSKDSAGCKKDKGFDKTCAALKKVADVYSNSFGEARVVVVKAGKTQPLDTCNTNANVAVLLAATDGASVVVGKQGTPVELAKGEPLVVDFCQEVKLDASAKVPVLFAQAWHPEFAAVERTTEIRARAKSFGLSEDAVKETTKMVNDFAKKSWEKGAKLWRKDSDIVAKLRDDMKAEVSSMKAEAEAAADAKRREDEAGDEERKRNLAELERKRDEKRAKAEAEEQKRRERKRQLEEEKARKDPWLLAPEVKAAEETLADLKEQRRDANAKLEFDLSTTLTKEISAQERVLKKTIKAAKKAHKKALKGGSKEPSEDSGDVEEMKDEEKKDDGKSKELKKLKTQLEEVNRDKLAAAEKEDFKKAKELKATAKDLEEQIKKLEL